MTSMRKLAIGAWGSPTDPSVHVQLDINVDALVSKLGNAFNQTYKYYVIKALSKTMATHPSLKTTVIGQRFRQRSANRLFIPTVFRHHGRVDLNGISIDDADTMSINELAKCWREKLSNLRTRRDRPTWRVIRVFRRLPTWLATPVMWGIGVIQYGLNVNVARWGLPNDAFGSMTVTFLDAFDVRYANIPLYPYARSSLTLAIGKPYQHNDTHWLPITVTFDHRCLDGYEAARAYKYLKRCLQHPDTL